MNGNPFPFSAVQLRVTHRKLFVSCETSSKNGETLGYRNYMSRGFPTALLKVVMNMPALQLERVPAVVLLASKT